ncbi:UvrD-helicase domain-containing protein [Candidatus Neptunochlamydia vexilliferae]|uniref:RecBCD enzyme subunit RecB n=1 Tax=Candidatus Neptunichlamydia vexilliferae TaxID=1651774 RepID=A0ABS0B0P2_9BACT|nr:UvrD-helicase domain-containing protein [Candidatus Neptunochlamydia vexilliferae]MBF5059966.1 DNA helicase [Candidatus Neptunochlamydia vexilliferae]
MKRFDVLDPRTPLLGHHFLEASAGTGKTFAIEHITARLIAEQRFSIDEILIVTFTRAATRELKVRIHETLKKCPPSFPLQKALALVDQAQIFTIHGFCHRMLTEYAFEAGLEFTLLSEEESDYQAILADHITDFFRTSLTSEEYSTPQLIKLFQSRADVLNKVLNLIEKEGEFPDYPPFNHSHERYNAIRPTLSPPLDLILQFNKIKNKEGEIKEPYKTQVALLEKKYLNREEFETLTASESVLSLTTEENLSKRAFSDPRPLYNFRDQLLPILEPATSPLCTLVRIARSVGPSALRALEEKEILSPNDILKRMGEALSRPPFREKVRSRYRAAIIDEFQDTDPIQWNIFKTLFIDDPIPALYLVGDPKQSIYSFRSADIYTYLNAEKMVSEKGYLDTNYRSDPALIQALNTLFSKNPNWLSLPDAPLPFHPVKHPEGAANRPFPDDKEPIHFFAYETKKKKWGSWPTIEIEETIFFPFIAREILNLTKKGFQYSDFAILVKDRHQSVRLKTYLESCKIPTSSKRNESLTSSPTFSLVRSLLEALIDPSEVPVKRFLSHLYNHQDLKENQELLTETTARFAQPQSLERALRTLYTPTDLETYADYTKLSELLLSHPGTLEERLASLLDHKEIPRVPLADPNSVTIMTIHMSKGLEFNIVFALGLINRYTGRETLIRHDKEWLPFHPDHPKCKAALHRQEAEKLRQLYVALTRAKHRLYIPLLRDTSNTPIPLGQASPLELFDPEPTDVTYLFPAKLPPEDPTFPELHSPTSPSLIYPSRTLHSYSSLAHTTPQPPVDVETDLPKGAETGVLLHSLLETLLLNPDTSIETLLQKRLPPHFPFETTAKLLHHALHTPLSPHPFSLSEVKHLYPEVEFLYPDGPNFIKGFIDLVFKHNDHYFLLDWKTNLLPSYDPKTLHETMAHHDYTLQALLYNTALSRYLKGAPIGGTYYIFLRGLPDEGILFLPYQTNA